MIFQLYQIFSFTWDANFSRTLMMFSTLILSDNKPRRSIHNFFIFCIIHLKLHLKMLKKDTYNSNFDKNCNTDWVKCTGGILLGHKKQRIVSFRKSVNKHNDDIIHTFLKINLNMSWTTKQETKLYLNYKNVILFPFVSIEINFNFKTGSN